MIEIKETNIKDIDNVQRLWADGDVMQFVGFPNPDKPEKYLNAA